MTTTLISSQGEQIEVQLDLFLGSHGTENALVCVLDNPVDPSRCQLCGELFHAPNTTENRRGWNLFGLPAHAHTNIYFTWQKKLAAKLPLKQHSFSVPG